MLTLDALLHSDAGQRKEHECLSPIVYIDTSAIREGKLDELEVAMKDLTAFVEANVPQLISYGFFLDEDRTQMTVVAVHPDSASLEFHMDVGGAEFRKFADLIDSVEDRGLWERKRGRTRAPAPEGRDAGERNGVRA